MHISRYCICQLFRILSILLKNLTKYRKINLLCNAKTPRLTIHKVCDVYHHIGEYLYKPFLCLYPHKRNRCILNLLGHLHCHFLALLTKNFTAKRIHHILCENLILNPIFQCKFFVKLISTYFCQVISSGVKKHCCHKIFCTVQTKRLSRTNLTVKLLQTLLIIIGSIFCEACKYLGFFSKQFENFLICTNSQCPN
ncbi:hypothetical protein IMSAGC011_03659 [Lachnospiraceae bacterium]|nr:hypothetical protein IMSAGC011_03659 [Lachnospiraceae bacterium]